MADSKLNISLLIFRGILIAFLYFEITKANDTSVYNVFTFTMFFLAMSVGAHAAGVDTNAVTGAFITKAVFTLVDERIKKPKEIRD